MGVPISTIEEGFKAIIKSIDLNYNMKKKLIEIGITPKAKLMVVNKQKSGYMVVATESFKLALDDFITKRIIVELLI